jgi:hypothetical protein
MAVDDLIAQIMATEGMGDPGAGGNLADIFQPARVITPSSPAPMQAARLQAPKPTADMVPGADAYRRAQEVRERTERGPTPEERVAANSRVQELIAGLPTGAGERAPVVAAAMPAAAPAAVAEAAPEAAPEKPKFASRYRPLLEQAEAELERLDILQQAATAQGREAPPELASKFENLSGKVSQLKSLVAAEEGAVVNAERAAVLERQTQRLSREEELIDRTRRLAPGNALMAFGTALAGARPGEKFASALARGLAAGSESYTGARDARDASLRGIEERRDALILQNEDAIEKARADAIALARTGVEMDAQQLALTKLKREDVKSLATQKADIDLAVAKASSAQTEAKYAPQVYEAEIDSQRALAEDRRRPPASGGSGGSGTLSPTQAGLRGVTSKKDLTDLEKMIIESDKNEDHANTEQLLNQYKFTRDAFNRNAVAAGRAPIAVRGFPVKLPKYEDYVKKNKRHPSGITSGQYKAGRSSSGTGGQSRPAGVGPDWKLEKDSKGNEAWVNPSRTKFVEI